MNIPNDPDVEILQQRITELEAALKEAQQENASLRAKAEAEKERAEAADRAKRTFLVSVSHELRTPLNAVLGYSERLEDDAKDALAPDLRKFQTEGRRLLRLINDILDLSKIEMGRLALFLETFDADALVDEVIAMVQPIG
jgi:signal transduction histidine kinase